MILDSPLVDWAKKHATPESCPGFHSSMVAAALSLKSMGVGSDNAVRIIGEGAAKVHRRSLVCDEIENIVAWAYGTRTQKQCKKTFRRKSPQVKQDLRLVAGCIKRNAVKRKEYCAIENLRLDSEQSHLTAGERLSTMFAPDELVCIALNVRGTEIRTMGEWARMDLSGHQFIVPNPLISTTGGRKTGNISERRFLIFETDHGALSLDDQAEIIYRLAEELPLQMVVWSAGKSLHAWFDLRGVPPRKIEGFEKLCIGHLADKKTLRPSQLVRLPNGHRPIGGRQDLIYFRP